MGLCQDTELPAMYAWSRVLRIADGPDEVHYRAIAKMEMRTQNLAKLWTPFSVNLVSMIERNSRGSAKHLKWAC